MMSVEMETIDQNLFKNTTTTTTTITTAAETTTSTIKDNEHLETHYIDDDDDDEYMNDNFYVRSHVLNETLTDTFLNSATATTGSSTTLNAIINNDNDSDKFDLEKIKREALSSSTTTTTTTNDNNNINYIIREYKHETPLDLDDCCENYNGIDETDNNFFKQINDNTIKTLNKNNDNYDYELKNINDYFEMPYDNIVDNIDQQQQQKEQQQQQHKIGNEKIINDNDEIENDYNFNSDVSPIFREHNYIVLSSASSSESPISPSTTSLMKFNSDNKDLHENKNENKLNEINNENELKLNLELINEFTSFNNDNNNKDSNNKDNNNEKNIIELTTKLCKQLKSLNGKILKIENNNEEVLNENDKDKDKNKDMDKDKNKNDNDIATVVIDDYDEEMLIQENLQILLEACEISENCGETTTKNDNNDDDDDSSKKLNNKNVVSSKNLKEKDKIIENQDEDIQKKSELNKNEDKNDKTNKKIPSLLKENIKIEIKNENLSEISNELIPNDDTTTSSSLDTIPDIDALEKELLENDSNKKMDIHEPSHEMQLSSIEHHKNLLVNVDEQVKNSTSLSNNDNEKNKMKTNEEKFNQESKSSMSEKSYDKEKTTNEQTSTMITDTENSSLIFLENRSEPLEYDLQNDDMIIEEIESPPYQIHKPSSLSSIQQQQQQDEEFSNNEKDNNKDDFVSKNNDTENVTKETTIGEKEEEEEEKEKEEDEEKTNEFKDNFKNLQIFTKNLYENCEKFSPINQNQIIEFIEEKFNEFKNLLKNFKNFKNTKNIEIQTDIVGNELFKERKKKINEKMKHRLLLSSSSSDESNDGSDEDVEEKEKNIGDDDNVNEFDKKESEEYIPKVFCENDDNDNDEEKIIKNNHQNEEEEKEEEEEGSDIDSQTETEPFLIGGIDLSKCVDTEDIINMEIDDVKNSINSIDFDNFDDDDNNDQFNLTPKTIKSIILNDEKLNKLKPIVLCEKLNQNDFENYFDNLRDKEIDRLLDFKNLLNPKASHSHEHTNRKKDEKKKEKSKTILDVFNTDGKESSSDDSNSENEEKVLTEKEYLEMYNNSLKKQLLNSSSSGSESDESDIEDLKIKNDKKINDEREEEDNEYDDDDDDDDDDVSSDESEFLMEKFLKCPNDGKNDDKNDTITSKENIDDPNDNGEESENSIKNEKITQSLSSSNQVEKDNVQYENDKTENKNDNSQTNSNEKKKQEEDDKEKCLDEEKNKNDNENVNDDINDGDKQQIKKRFRDHIYDSTRKILTENEFDLETLSNDDKDDDDKILKNDDDNDDDIDKNDDDNNDSSDCEILDDIQQQQLQTKKRRRQKSVETLVAEATLRKTLKANNNNNQFNKNIDDLISLSSSSEPELEDIQITSSSITTKKYKDNDNDNNDDIKKQRFSKPMLRQDQLAGETRLAQKHENERIRRLDKKQKMMKDILDKTNNNDTTELILDYNPDTKTFIKVHSEIVKHMKPHQIDGIKFMYDNCYGSVKDLKTHPGSGCILAHCMGLGKTFQLIALLHTVISYKELNTTKILILCPKSTVMNWCDEIRQWLHPFKKNNIKLYYFPDTSDIKIKLKMLEEWSQCGTTGIKKPGVFLIGYEAFRTLVFQHSYKKKGIFLTPKERDIVEQKIKKYLLQPGADLVICDEGHIIKNRKAAISSAVTQIKTPRRIILTGTPIQNNLKEYYSMVNFIKPSFLGTEREFGNLYANPIKNGQHKDSSKREIKIMKQRSFVLHKKLSKFVQRREAALLKTFLPKKYEYVLFVPMTTVQKRLYQFFLDAISHRQGSKGKSLIPDYTCLRKIWTHPKVLEIAWQNAINEKLKKQDNPSTSLSTTTTTMSKSSSTPILNSDDEVPDDVYDNQTGELSVINDWWRPLVTKEDLETLLPSNKLVTMFEILRMCEENHEKCLIFSAFVAVLNVVEYFMQQIHRQNHEFLNNSGFDRFKGPWVPNKDYYRLDGKTSKTLRHGLVKQFNDPNNLRTRCFLISAKAGGQGINLIGANRVIILDTSWNPSNDQQNIFRIYRLGQQKKCYVYRLLSMGTMEEKVYSRSVTKQAMSFRVVDEQQIDRHYSMAELTELYTLTEPDYSERPTPTLPQDNVLANLLRNYPNLIYKYHEHDSLLENKMEQELSEEEKADAWAQYERDIQISQEPPVNAFDNSQIPYNHMRSGGYAQGNFPIPYPFPGLPSLTGLNPYSTAANPIFNLYNMYQNYADYSTLMSRLNAHQPGTSSMGSGLQSPFLPNFLQSPSSSSLFSNDNAGNGVNLSNLSAASSLLQTPTSNGMPLGMSSLSYNQSLNAPSSQRSPFITTPSTSSYTSSAAAAAAAATVASGLYSPLMSSTNPQPSTSSGSSGLPDKLFSDLRKLLDNPPKPTNMPPLAPFGALTSTSSPLTISKNQQPQPSSLMTQLNMLQNKPSLSNEISILPNLSPIRNDPVSTTPSPSSVDSIPTNIIRRTGSSSPSLTNSKTAPHPISKNPSEGSLRSVRNNKTETSNISGSNITSPSSSKTNNDSNMTKRSNNIGIVYFDKSPTPISLNSSATSKSSLSSSSVSLSPISSPVSTTNQRSSNNISVRSVNSINEGSSNSRNPVSTANSVSNNNNNSNNQNNNNSGKDVTYQRISLLKSAEKELSKMAGKSKLIESAKFKGSSSPIRISSPSRTVSNVQQKNKTVSGGVLQGKQQQQQQVINTNSGTITIAKTTIPNKTVNKQSTTVNPSNTTTTTSSSSSLGVQQGARISGTTGKGLSSSTSAILPSSTSPSLTISATRSNSLLSSSNLQNTKNLGGKTLSSTSLKTSQQQQQQPNKTTTISILGGNKQSTTNSNNSSSLSEMIKNAVNNNNSAGVSINKNNQLSSSTQLQNFIKNNVRRPSPASSVSSNNSNQSNTSKNQQQQQQSSTTNLNQQQQSSPSQQQQQRNISIKRSASLLNSNNKNNKLIKTITTSQQPNKIISSPTLNNSAINRNNNNNNSSSSSSSSSSSNQQLINIANKNTLNSLNNRSDLSIRPIDTLSSLKSSTTINSSPNISRTKSNITITGGPNNSGGGGGGGVAGTGTPIITQVTSLNSNTINSQKNNAISRKRSATTINFTDDLPNSLRQVKKIKKSTDSSASSSSSNMGVSESLLRIQSVQSLSVFPKSSTNKAQLQSNQKSNEGILMWKKSGSGRN